jgi:spermidine synthase
MGGTLPAFARGILGSPAGAGKGIGRIYGINTFGAAAGTLGVGYFLLPAFGVRITIFAGAAANLISGAVAFLLSGGAAPAQPSIPNDPEIVPDPLLPDRFGKKVLWALAASGGVGMLYEVVWTRSLILVIGSSTYAFSAILFTFLLGIAGGAFLYARLRGTDHQRLFAMIQFGIALFGFLLLRAFDLLPGLFHALLKGARESFPRVELLQLGTTSLVMLGPTVLMGMTIPCAVEWVGGGVRELGKDFGRCYAWNTAGAIVGTSVAGFLLIPHLGAQKSLCLGFAINVLIGFAILPVASRTRKAALGLVLTAVCTAVFLSPSWGKGILSSGAYLRGNGPDAERWSVPEDPDVLFFREGINSTVSVIREPDGSMGLRINGKTDANNSWEMETLANTANIPMLLHRNPKRVAIIGLGIGVTAGAAAGYPGVDQIDVVELEPAVAEASTFFRQENRNVLQDRRVALHFHDGRSFLKAAKGSYDVVISQPSNPWIAGIATLFTREFLSTVGGRLGDGGIYCQWVQGFRISASEMKILARTFLSVFPDATMWLAGPSAYLLLGGEGATGDPLEEAVPSLQGGAAALPVFARFLGSTAPEGLIARFLMGPRELRAYAGEGPLNTDDLPVLEFSAPRSLYGGIASQANWNEISRFRRSAVSPYVARIGQADPGIYSRLGQALLSQGRGREAAEMFRRRVSAGGKSGRRRTPRAAQVADLRGVSGEVREDFEGGGASSALFPLLGNLAPGNGNREQTAVWEGYSDYFAAVSGVFRGVGISGSRGLAVRSLPDVGTVAWLMPVMVHPSRSYTVDFSMKSELFWGGEGGVGWMAFDTSVTTPEEMTGIPFGAHLLQKQDAVRIRGAKDWNRYTFSFETPPGSQMVCLVFYREGLNEPEPLVFDDIRIRETSP